MLHQDGLLPSLLAYGYAGIPWRIPAHHRKGCRQGHCFRPLCLSCHGAKKTMEGGLFYGTFTPAVSCSQFVNGFIAYDAHFFYQLFPLFCLCLIKDSFQLIQAVPGISIQSGDILFLVLCIGNNDFPRCNGRPGGRVCLSL